MGMDDRPGDTYDKIINGYLVTMKNHDDRCSIMHSASSCSCGADSYNYGVRLGAENQLPKDPPDKIPLTYYQLTQRISKADIILQALDGAIPHDPGCFDPSTDCRCYLRNVRENLKSARKLLSL